MGLFRKQGRVSFFRVPSCSTDMQSCTGRGRLFLRPQPVPGTSACWESRQHRWEPGTQHIPGRWHVCGPLVHTPAQNLVSLSGSRLARSSAAVPAMPVGEQSGQSCKSHSPWGRRYLCTHPNTQTSREGRGCPPWQGNLQAPGLRVRLSSAASHLADKATLLWLHSSIRRAGVLRQLGKMVPLRLSLCHHASEGLKNSVSAKGSGK